MKLDGNHKHRMTGLLIFMLAVVSVAAVVSTRDDLILGRATSVASVKEWALPTFLNGYPTQSAAESSKLEGIYFWLNENEILTFRRSGDGLIPLRTKLKSTTSGEVSEAIPGVLLKGKLETVSVSHDGNSLLWYEIFGNHNIIAHIASLNSARSAQFPIEDWKRFAWSLSDDSLLFTQSTKTGYDLRFRNVVNGSVRATSSGKTPLLINEYTELSLTASDTARFNTYDPSGIPQLCIGDISLSNPSLPIRKIVIPILKNESVETIILSPIGDKILVTTAQIAPNFWEKAYANVCSYFQPKTKVKRREWHVYSIEGSRKSLGYTNQVSSNRTPYETVPGIGIGGVKWTPDGKNISFIYQKKLYLLPVNG